MNEQRKAWLDSLKVGDEVAYFYCGELLIRPIRRITPARLFDVDDCGLFGRNGGREWNNLVPVTPDIRRQVATDKARYRNGECIVELDNLAADNPLALAPILEDALAKAREVAK